MKKNKILLLILSLFCMVSFVSCDRYPVEAIVGLGSPIKSWPDPWYIYDDQINTRGSMEPYVWKDDPYCATWGYAKVDFSWMHNVKRGNKCMYFTYIGNNSDSSGATYFGFGLMAREVLGEKIAIGKAGYNNMKFWIRGELYNNCKFVIEIPGTGVKRTITSAEITSEWQEIIVPMSSIVVTDEIEFDIAFSLAAIDGDVKTNGGTVYLDDITFEK